ncbi:MAG TPA: TrkA family potassium uptake protein, partial [bacterium]|nr:TrkA family potassium uptake protein [bacterium]
VGMGRNIQASIMITLLLKELGIKKIVAKAANFMHGKALRKIGAHKIVYPEIDMGERVAKSIVSENVYEQIELVQGYALVELLVPSKYIGEKIKDSNIRTKFNLNIVAIFHNYSETDKSKMKILVPQADYEFKEKDVMIVFGEEKDIDKFKK